MFFFRDSYINPNPFLKSMTLCSVIFFVHTTQLWSKADFSVHSQPIQSTLKIYLFLLFCLDSNTVDTYLLLECFSIFCICLYLEVGGYMFWIFAWQQTMQWLEPIIEKEVLVLKFIRFFFTPHNNDFWCKQTKKTKPSSM